jgi:hypothetical protein
MSTEDLVSCNENVTGLSGLVRLVPRLVITSFQRCTSGEDRVLVPLVEIAKVDRIVFGGAPIQMRVCMGDAHGSRSGFGGYL